jgi:hypothetical protein
MSLMVKLGLSHELMWLNSVWMLFQWTIFHTFGKHPALVLLVELRGSRIGQLLLVAE